MNTKEYNNIVDIIKKNYIVEIDDENYENLYDIYLQKFDFYLQNYYKYSKNKYREVVGFIIYYLIYGFNISTTKNIYIPVEVREYYKEEKVKRLVNLLGYTFDPDFSKADVNLSYREILNIIINNLHEIVYEYDYVNDNNVLVLLKMMNLNVVGIFINLLHEKYGLTITKILESLKILDQYKENLNKLDQIFMSMSSENLNIKPVKTTNTNTVIELQELTEKDIENLENLNSDMNKIDTDKISNKKLKSINNELDNSFSKNLHSRLKQIRTATGNNSDSEYSSAEDSDIENYSDSSIGSDSGKDNIPQPQVQGGSAGYIDQNMMENMMKNVSQSQLQSQFENSGSRRSSLSSRSSFSDN